MFALNFETCARCLTLAFSLAAVACHATSIDVVECASDGNCPANQRCGPDHSCVDSGIGPKSTRLRWDGLGRLHDNPFGIRGQWSRLTDCSNVELKIQEGTFSCPSDAPTPGCCNHWDPDLVGFDLQPGWTVRAADGEDDSGSVCVKGQTSPVLNRLDGMPGYDVMWGNAVSLWLNDRASFDATQEFEGGPMTGISLDLLGPPGLPLAVIIGVVGVFDAYVQEEAPPTNDVTLRFDEMEQPSWVTTRIPFDPSKISDVAVQAISRVEGTSPFDYCVENVRVLQ